MRGLLYREYRMLFANIISFLFMPLLLLIMAVVLRELLAIGNVPESDENTKRLINGCIELIGIFSCGADIICSQSIGLVAFGNMEEKKLHLRYIAASPTGTRGIVDAKFLFYFISAAAGIAAAFITGIILLGKPMVFGIMLLSEIWCISGMLHIPVFIRFGRKRGTYVSSAIFMAVLIAGLVWLLFGDIGLSEENMVPLPELMINSVTKMMNVSDAYLCRPALILLPVTVVITAVSVILSRRWFRTALEYSTDDV